jgi:alpha-amylase/alpha-mannosidase (GH57 family)
MCPPRLTDRETELDSAFLDILASLVAAVSSYENYAGNSKRPGVRDALYNTRLADYKQAIQRARHRYRELFLKENTNVPADASNSD